MNRPRVGAPASALPPRPRWGALLATLAVALASCRSDPPAPSSSGWPGVTTTTALPEDRVALGQTVVVPIHSSLATADNGRVINLAATLTVRNADLTRPIVVDRIRYHDSGGQPVRSFLATPVRVAPLAAVDLFVGESDSTGGATPSFVVEWTSEAEVAPALVEAVMISTAGTQGITLTAPGRVVSQRSRSR